MRLSHLEIFGFKSFAQKVEIPFGPGITAVVGPNGCGKSNIVEAIRWVLGEQRAGVFRSHRMEEVIFAGARGRKPLGMAEVSLTIENTNNILPIEFSEVTMTRRLFRSGESDYLLNKIPCRLLDIHNLLMDTGLGQGAYAVMEQGMVDEIISEKTENRRRILEEAAGITKYKVRRRSTWSRLESTTADLTRIEDIIAEVKRQVDYMSRQVGRARRYQEFKKEFDEKEVLLGRIRFFTTLGKLRPLQSELDQLNAEATEGYTEFTTREAALEKLRLAQTEAESALQDVGRKLNQQTENIHGRERELVALSEQLNAAVGTIERSEREQQDSNRQLEEYTQLLHQAGQGLVDARQELESIDLSLSDHQEHSLSTEQNCTTQRSQLESKNRQNMDLVRQQGELNRGLERLVTEREGLASSAESLRGESASLKTDLDNCSKNLQDSRSASLELEAKLQAQSDRHNQELEQSRSIQQKVEESESRREDLRRAIEANQARRHVMEKVQAGYEGYSSGVRTLMLESPHADLFVGVLGDLIEVDAEFKHAAETALGQSLEALIAPAKENVAQAIEYLKTASGRASLFALDWQKRPPNAVAPANATGLIGPLADHVRASDPAVNNLVLRLLSGTFVVDGLTAAVELAESLQHPLRLVTLQGESVETNGRISGGEPARDDAVLIGRRQEIGALQSTIAEQKARLTSVNNALAGELKRSQIVAVRVREVADELERLKELLREQRTVTTNLEMESTRHRTRLSQLEVEQAQLAERSEGLSESIRTQEEKLIEREREAEALARSIREQEERLQADEAVLRNDLEQLAALRAEQARIKEQTQSLEREKQRLEAMQRSLQGNLDRLAVEVEQAAAAKQDLGEKQRQCETQLKEMHESRDDLMRDSDSKRQAWDSVNAETRGMEEEIGNLQRELNSQRERRHQLELRISELQSHSAHVRERMQEEHQCDVEAMGRPQEEVELEGLEERVESLRQSIQRLGAVHVGILDEFEEQKERYDFLCIQRDDLLAAAEDLRKTLSLIDRTARRMFKETFEEIREQFKQTFAQFFPGGEADLQLQADVDPLEADIDIIAKPRGKRLQSITLLSGGEKALTAISLLFAIYLVKPSPFCILDEVDAPLDDANIHRFVKVLKEFARTTQFVMVTHNKISMHAAHSLHGVTMPEEGISQLVSVQLEEEMLEEAAG